MKTLSHAREVLERDITMGVFTPFLGAGASSLRTGVVKLQTPPWDEVAATLTAIASQLNTARSWDFLRSFTEHRLGLEPLEVAQIIPASDQPKPSRADRANLNKHLLVRFGAELVRSTVRLTQYFAARFSRESPSIQYLEHCNVEFDLTSEEAGDSLKQLFVAADLALELWNRDTDERESPFLVRGKGVNRQLEIERLYEKLVILIVGLVGDKRKDYQYELSKHRIGSLLPIPDEILDGRVAHFGKLRLDAIQWLSDLLWYTIRYWVPCYPTSAELAFELALAARNAPSGRAELAQAAQALENESDEIDLLARTVGDLVRYCEMAQAQRRSPDEQTRIFYVTIATVMQDQFIQYEEALARPSRLSLKERFFEDSEKADAERAAPLPIAFTTNFDSALERVFAENDLAYHVVFPVIGRKAEAGHPGGLRWRIRTYYPASKGRDESDQDWFQICDDSGSPKIGFIGPIIVKLHGSPATPLRQKDFEHCIILSEASYLQAFGMPFWLEQQLSLGWAWRGGFESLTRSLWFLGYSVSDWNVRHCLARGSSSASGAGRRFAVNRDNDLYKRILLEKLSVGQFIGDLNDFASMIKDILRSNVRFRSYC